MTEFRLVGALRTEEGKPIRKYTQLLKKWQQMRGEQGKFQVLM